MKKIVLILAFLAAWQFFHTNTSSTPATADTSQQNISTEVHDGFSDEVNMQEERISPQPTPSNNFKCDGRVYCTQMTSLEEAEFFIRNCPGTKMDLITTMIQPFRTTLKWFCSGGLNHGQKQGSISKKHEHSYLYSALWR